MASTAGTHIGSPTGLAPGAIALVEASKQLLMDGGMDALRIEKITKAAGQSKAMVSYYFGGKAALLAAVVDSLIHEAVEELYTCLLYTSPSPRDRTRSRMPSSA